MDFLRSTGKLRPSAPAVSQQVGLSNLPEPIHTYAVQIRDAELNTSLQFYARNTRTTPEAVIAEALRSYLGH